MKKINALLGLAIILLAVGNVVAEENSTSMPVIDMYYIDYNLADVTRQNCNESNQEKIEGMLQDLSTNMSLWGVDKPTNRTKHLLNLVTWIMQKLYEDTCSLQWNFDNLNKTLTRNIKSCEQQISFLSDVYPDNIPACKGSIISDLTLIDENNRLTLENQKLKYYSETQKFFGVFLMLVIMVLVSWMVYSYYIRKDIKKIKGEIIK